MKTIIQKKIKEIEAVYDIQVLYACESGSRAWGFASVDSDYDVRLIYKRKKETYLSVVETQDFLQLPIDEVWDFNAWDLKKVLKLVFQSNTTIFEWIQSPIVYRETAGFKKELEVLCQQFYCQQTHTHHYLGLAKKKMEAMKENQVKYKTLFYILRALLSAKWNAQHGSIAPMEFKPLLELVEDPVLKKDILQLMEEKAKATEQDFYTWKVTLKKYVSDLYVDLARVQVQKKKGTFEVERLNEFFRKEVNL
ncbi:nucleotidyltransferase domain-containing protein [Myroides sp. 1354]|uniref:nucleotidyltransferase domain-containing protein n=1 Tax=unclassified Myroides TaxID=2642485 RepID=UPI002578EF3D|nr:MULTISPECIES: nucleotidyltransferase domain-containing protein [unclassified Myroides]MDM1044126.1 nucleotidyltransferase domain-containing protein [Myroides sp. R163-1]MDM1055061.1 nucleotidyltransferase domain-containing protein [Myroides sp. 1354]MDM1068358.1 nucleotidyltransferase domain-containing protein [Myroides sp. 1372]